VDDVAGRIWQALRVGRAGSLAASDVRRMAVQLKVAALRAAQGGNGSRRRAGQACQIHLARSSPHLTPSFLD